VLSDAVPYRLSRANATRRVVECHPVLPMAGSFIGNHIGSAATFWHLPQTHRGVASLVANLVEGTDGRWSSAVHPEIYRHATARPMKPHWQVIGSHWQGRPSSRCSCSFRHVGRPSRRRACSSHWRVSETARPVCRFRHKSTRCNGTVCRERQSIDRQVANA
jgi:hypothetical protein